MTAAKRAELIYRIAELVAAERRGAGADRVARQRQAGQVRAVVDVRSTAAHLRYYAGWPTKIEGETIPVDGARHVSSTRARSRSASARRSSPGTFPLLMAAWKLAPALAAGCTVVLKPAEQTPLSVLRLGQLLLEAGLPRGRRQHRDRRRGDRRAAWSSTRGGQDRLHGLDGGWARDRRQGRCPDQARDARARRQEPQHHPSGRRHRRGRSRAPIQGMYFNSGQACNAGHAPVRPEGALRRRRRRHWPSARARPASARASIPRRSIGPLVSAGAARTRHRLHRVGSSKRARSCVAGGKAHPEGTPAGRLLRRAERCSSACATT